MDLEQIYSARIQNSKSSWKTAISSPFGSPTIERDPNVIQLESNVFSRLCDISNSEATHCCSTPTRNSSDVRFVSFEEAIRELAAK